MSEDNDDNIVFSNTPEKPLLEKERGIERKNI